MNETKVVRLSGRRWYTRDSNGDRLWISYDERHDLWEVKRDDLEEHLDRDLRAVLAETLSADIDDPWIVVLADELEHDLSEAGGRT